MDELTSNLLAPVSRVLGGVPLLDDQGRHRCRPEVPLLETLSDRRHFYPDPDIERYAPARVEFIASASLLNVRRKRLMCVVIALDRLFGLRGAFWLWWY